MSTHIHYQGKFLGRIKPTRDLMKWVLALEGVGALETLLRLQPTDELQIDESTTWTYERFQKEILEKTVVIYTSLEAYVRSEFPFPFGRKIPEEIVKEFGL